MKKIFNFKQDENMYILENTNPGETKTSFVIDKEVLEFDSEKFYEYVFSDIEDVMEIEIINSVVDANDRAAKRVYDTIHEICQGVIEKMNEECVK